ncbi:MAG: 3-keto-5-aminohexanoate cleavage protein [Gaiellaceae bacterium]
MSELLPKLIVNVALTGMVPTKAENPAVPITPDEIADDAARCVQAGASIVHFHARDEQGQPSWRPEIYREIVSRVRERCDDVIVCVTTSGRLFSDYERRAKVLDLEDGLLPEMASLTLGSLNFPQQASLNEPATIRSLAERMSERGIVPELEVFDFGMVDYAKYLISRDVLRPPFYFNLLLGSLGTLSATTHNLVALSETLPQGSTWAAAGIGRFQRRMNNVAVAMGGHVRTGLEDNLYLDLEKQHAATNAALVERVVAVAEAVGRSVATVAEARGLIGLPRR